MYIHIYIYKICICVYIDVCIYTHKYVHMNIVVCVHSFRLVLSIDTQSYIMCNPPQTDSQDMKREPPDQMGFPTLTKPRDFRIGTEQLCFNLTWGKNIGFL